MKKILFLIVLSGLELSGFSQENYFISGVEKELAGDYAGAIADFDRVIEMSPYWGKAYLERGLAKIAAGQNEGGCTDLRKAEERGLDEAVEAIGKYCK